MYRRPKFLETLIEIRLDMAREADFDVDLFVETVRTGPRPPKGAKKTDRAVPDTDIPDRVVKKRQRQPR